MEGFTTHQEGRDGNGRQSFDPLFETIRAATLGFPTLGITFHLEVKGPFHLYVTCSAKGLEREAVRFRDFLNQSLSQPGEECAALVSEPAKPEGS